MSALLVPGFSIWTDYTPTITAQEGTFTDTSAVASYCQIGPVVFFQVTLTITTVGTGQGPIFSLPIDAVFPVGGGYTFAGRETVETGVAWTATVDATDGAGVARCQDYSNSPTVADGYVIEYSGCYGVA
jgi:hypothetical protein